MAARNQDASDSHGKQRTFRATHSFTNSACWASVIVAAFLSMSATAGLASAQTTRADTIRAEREAKEEELAPHSRSLVESVLFKIEDRLLVERLLSPPRGFHLRLGGIGEGAGFGVGPAFRRNTEALDLRASAAASFKRYFIGEASVRFPGTPLDSLFVTRDGPSSTSTRGGVIIPRRISSVSVLTAASRTGRTTGFWTRSCGSPGSASAARVGRRQRRLSRSMIASGTDTRMPSTDDLRPATLPGSSGLPTFTTFEPYVEIKTIYRPTTRCPAATIASASAAIAIAISIGSRSADGMSICDSTSGSSRGPDDRLAADARLGGGRRRQPGPVLPAADPRCAQDAARVPLVPLPRESALLLQAEYRWRINELIAGALFYDTGAVARRLGDIGRLERDYGMAAGRRPERRFVPRRPRVRRQRRHPPAPEVRRCLLTFPPGPDRRAIGALERS